MRGLFSAEGIQPARAENRTMKDQDSAAKMAAPHNGEVINRQESYQQAPAPSPKKAEGKRGIPPLTPYGEKGRVKKQDGGSFGTLQDRAGAHAPNVSGASPSKSSSRPCTLSGANLTLNDSVSGRNTPGSIFAAQSEARSHFDPAPSSSSPQPFRFPRVSLFTQFSSRIAR